MDQHKRLRIAYHETGHAVMALLCRQEVKEVSLKGMEMPEGVDKFLGFMQLQPVDPGAKFTVEKAIQKIMISLGGYASEILFCGGVAGIGGNDLSVAIKTTEGLLEFDEIKSSVAKLPVPAPNALDMIDDALVRTYINQRLDECVQVLSSVTPAIQLITEELFQKETLSGAEVLRLFFSVMQAGTSD